MGTDNATFSRQALVLFNFWLKKQPKDKHIGDLTIGDFVEMIAFLAEMETKNATN
jgi:hypothetical protein